MPLYHNATENTLRFEIDDERYEVPPGAQCEIPRKFSWVLKSRGLAMTPGASPDSQAKTVEPTAVSPSRPVYPEGVEVGPVRDAEDVDESQVEGSEDVDRVVADLGRKGVQVPGRARE